MHVSEDISEARRVVAEPRAAGRRVGVVPTMGALHVGHVSLIEAARAECDFVAVTIFVNPLQFGPAEDFTRYPRPLADDLALCRDAGADLVVRPAAEAMYPPGFATAVDVAGIATPFEGRSRPGHYRGVATVVLKLLQIVPADVAYFGQKDYQQQLLIRRMVADLNVPVEIRTCPTVRDADGLALSSRNVYLSAVERTRALTLSRSLFRARDEIEAGRANVTVAQRALQAALESEPAIVLDYAAIVDAETLQEPSPDCRRLVALVAAKVGATRLIDNVLITPPAGGESHP